MSSQKLKKLNNNEILIISNKYDWIKQDLKNNNVHFIIPKTITNKPKLKSAHDLESTARRFKQLGLFRKWLFLSKEYVKIKRQILLQDKTTEKWYFDACALEEQKIFNYIYNKSKNTMCIASHLSIGEAVSNFICKINPKLSLEEKNQRINAFLNFLDTLHKKYNLEIVGNDKILDVFKKIQLELPRLSFTDSIHLATAGVYNCSKIYSSDNDLTGISQNKIKKMGAILDIPVLSIIKVW